MIRDAYVFSSEEVNSKVLAFRPKDPGEAAVRWRLVRVGGVLGEEEVVFVYEFDVAEIWIFEFDFLEDEKRSKSGRVDPIFGIYQIIVLVFGDYI